MTSASLSVWTCRRSPRTPRICSTTAWPRSLSTVGLAASYVRGGLLISDHITPTVGELLRSREIHYVDGAGNASIRGPGVVIDVRGGRATTDSSTRARSPLFTRAGLPVVLAILNDPALLEACDHMADLAGAHLLGRLSGASFSPKRGRAVIDVLDNPEAAGLLASQMRRLSSADLLAAHRRGFIAG